MDQSLDVFLLPVMKNLGNIFPPKQSTILMTTFTKLQRKLLIVFVYSLLWQFFIAPYKHTSDFIFTCDKSKKEVSSRSLSRC
jgi:uncharacterized membrane protein YfbV (UPF0208 family)